MGFLKEYEHDIFVSYAHVNDKPRVPGNVSTRWVSSFRTTLQAYLDEKLGRSGSANIWMDRGELQGNEALSPEIEYAVRNSATLLIIMSQGYLAAEWCAQEREIFYQQNGGAENCANRVFIVHMEKIAQELWQGATRVEVIGYPFFEENAVTRNVRTLGDPQITVSELTYFERLRSLTYDIARSMRAGLPRKPLVTPTLATTVEPLKPSIFLAETTTDLYDFRENVYHHLERKGFEIVPTSLYNRAPDSYFASLAEDLNRASLFVQLLGPNHTAHAPDLPLGFEGLQWDAAKSLKKPTIRWRPQGVIDSIKNEAHRNFIFAEDVIESELEEFKRELEETVARIFADPAVRGQKKLGGDSLIGISACGPDTDVANQLAMSLEAYEIDYDLIPNEVSLSDVVEEDNYSALLVIFGESPVEWVRTRVRQCRQICMRHREDSPACGVYLPTEDPDKRLPLKFAQLQVIRGVLEELQNFLLSANRQSAFDAG